jgi:uncharacterized protein (TIGR02246 family)
MSDRDIVTSKDEAAIRELVRRRAAATERKDAAAAVALFTRDATSFELAPPLKLGPEQVHDTAALEQWYATWDGPIAWETRELSVTVGGDVAFAHALDRMRGTKTDGKRVDLWIRSTIGLRREGGAWKIAHSHSSVPFYMDGSDRAALDLTPGG